MELGEALDMNWLEMIKKKNAGTWRCSCRAFALFFAYTGFIWMCEFLDLLCWLMKVPQATLFSRLLSLALTVGAACLLAGHPRYDGGKRDVLYWLGWAAIFVFFAVKSIRPDLSYDTQNYHLLNQIPGFLDNIHYHAMPGKFQMYGFRLGDRLFYPFRLLLGLRMGTMLNALALLVVYRQLTVTLEKARESFLDGRSFSSGFIASGFWKFLTHPALLAFLLVSRMDFLQESGTYMVELVALPFLLEMIFLLLREQPKVPSGEFEIRSGREAVIFCLLGGFLFCLKMTNIIYLAPLVLFYIIKIRRSITPRLFFLCLTAGVLPVTVYLIYNTISVGNPVYPYYNKIFHSVYWGEMNFKDLRWGPDPAYHWRDVLLWPLYMIFKPSYRQSELPCQFTWDLAVGYIAMAGLILAAAGAFWKRKKAGFWPELYLIGLYGISLAAWILTTGHTRYFMAGFLVSGLITALVYLRLMARGGPAVLVGLALLAPFPERAHYGYTKVLEGQEWAMRDRDPDAYRKNARWVFRDHQLFAPEIREKVDVFFLTWQDCGSYARLIGEDVPVYNRYAILDELSAFQEEYLEQIEHFMREGKGVYDMFPQGMDTLEAYLEWMNEAGWYVCDLIYPDRVLLGPQSFTLAGITLADGRENCWILGEWEAADSGNGMPEGSGDAAGSGNAVESGDAAASAGESPESVFDDSTHSEMTVQKDGDTLSLSLRGILGDPEYWAYPAAYQAVVLASDGTQEKEAAVLELGESEYRELETELDVSGLADGEITLRLVSRQEGRRAVLINPQIESGGRTVR